MFENVANKTRRLKSYKLKKDTTLAIGLVLQVLCGNSLLAQTSAEIDLKGTVKSVVDSPTLYSTGQALKSNFKAAADSIGPQEISAAKLNLPQSFQITTNLRGVGQMVIVSPKGADAINEMIKLTSPNPATQATSLKALQEMSAEGVPEAENFMGFVFEYGLFGAVKDIGRAQQYYLAASKQGYGTATYNLATVHFFAKGGNKQDIRLAQKYASNAADSTAEASYRICGLASFINYRLHDSKSGIYSQNCNSALAGPGKVAYTKDGTQEQRIDWLKSSLSTGANDGYGELVRLALQAPPSPALLYCRFSVLKDYQTNSDVTGVKDKVRKCYTTSNTVPEFNSSAEKNARDERINGLSATIQQDLANIKQQRASNKTAYSLSVPYLPFQQKDVDDWKKLMPPKTN